MILVAAAIGLMSNGGMVLSPALASIMEHFSHVPVVLVQMLITVPALMMIPASIIASYLNRRVSSRSIFLCCLAALAAAGLLPFLVDSFPLIFASRIVVGIAIGSMTPLANALLANTFSGRERDRAIGILTASESFGGASMLFFSGIIVQFGWRYSFLIYLLAILQFCAVFLFCPKDDKVYASDGRVPAKAGVLNPTIVFVWVVFFVYMGFLNAFPPNISLFIEGEGLGNSTVVGAASALFQVSGFVCGLVYSRITKTFKGYTFVFGLAITGVGVAVVASSHSAAMVVLGAIISGFGMGVTLPTGNLKSAGSVSPEKSATAIALGASGYQLAQFMTTFMVNPIAGTIFGKNSVRGRFVVSAAVLCIWAALVFFATVILGRRRNRRASLP